MRLTHVAGIFAALILGSAASAQECVRAWYLPPREVARASDLVCTGVVQSVWTTHPDGDESQTPIYTQVEVRVEQTWKGAAGAGAATPTMVFRQTGGTCPHCGVTTRGEPIPDYRPGQRWLWCWIQTPQGWLTTYGMRHGAFRIDGETAVRDFTGYHFIDDTHFEGPAPRESFALATLKASMIGEAPTAPATSEARDEHPTRLPAIEPTRLTPATPRSFAPSQVAPVAPEPRSIWKLILGVNLILVALWILWKARR